MTADVQLTIVGWRHDEEYVSRIEAAIRAAPYPGNIRLVDPQPFASMAQIFAANQIVVLPSVAEPFGRVAAEAAASGLVTIVSDRTGYSECVVDGVHGCVFPAGNVPALQLCLERVMLDPEFARRLQREGRRHAAKCFSTARMVDEIEGFLASAVVSPTRCARFGKLTDASPATAAPSRGDDANRELVG